MRDAGKERAGRHTARKVRVMAENCRRVLSERRRIQKERNVEERDGVDRQCGSIQTPNRAQRGRCGIQIGKPIRRSVEGKHADVREFETELVEFQPARDEGEAGRGGGRRPSGCEQSRDAGAQQKTQCPVAQAKKKPAASPNIAVGVYHGVKARQSKSPRVK